MFYLSNVEAKKIQKLRRIFLSVGFLFILLCLFLNNGIINPDLQGDVFIIIYLTRIDTYLGKITVEIQGNTQKYDLECNGEGSNDVNKECQIFKQTVIFASLSLGFGGAALLLTFFSVKNKQASVFILIFIIIPIIFTIMMPTWKIIYANQVLTYKITPIILEFISFICYMISFLIGLLDSQKYKSHVGLLQ